MPVVDVHTHFSIETSPVSGDAEKLGYRVENRSITEHLAVMDALGIDVAVLSCPTIKYTLERPCCIRYIREVNKEGSRLSREYPQRFVFAAALPLPFIPDALEELECAKAEGACAAALVSNYEGMYLGDQRLEPLWTKLESLDMPVLLHPAAPQVYPSGPVTGKILPMFEFIVDTTRSVIDMICSGVFSRHPGLKVVVPHAGSCLPVALNRMRNVMLGTGRDVSLPVENLWYDLACDSFPQGVPILLEWTAPDHILYGTDFPAIPLPVLKDHLYAARTSPRLALFQEEILWKNAQALFRLSLC